MAVKGAVAKSVIIEKMKECFGNDFVGTQGSNKIFVNADDGDGTKALIALALTCPKTNPFQSVESDMIDFEAMDKVAAANDDITKEEEDNLKTLLERLNL